MSAKQYHLYFPQVKEEKRIFEKIIFFVQEHRKDKLQKFQKPDSENNSRGWFRTPPADALRCLG